MTTTELRKDWEKRVAAFKASGLSTKEWCATHDSGSSGDGRVCEKHRIL